MAEEKPLTPEVVAPDTGAAKLALAGELREYASTRDPELRDRLVEAHLPLARQLARRFASRGEPLDDLVQAASIGLIKAINGYDPDLGFEFAAYASRTILGELKRHFRDKGWFIRAPRRVQELHLSIGHSVDGLSQRLGRAPTVPELAADTGAPESEVLEALEASHAYRAGSLDVLTAEGESVGNRFGHEDPEFEVAEARSVLEEHLGMLSERELTIVRLRFFDDLTQSEIATRVGLSQMQVSRLLAQSLKRLHAAMAPAHDPSSEESGPD